MAARSGVQKLRASPREFFVVGRSKSSALGQPAVVEGNGLIGTVAVALKRLQLFDVVGFT